MCVESLLDDLLKQISGNTMMMVLHAERCKRKAQAVAPDAVVVLDPGVMPIISNLLLGVNVGHHR